MTIDEVETLEDLGIYFSDWVYENSNSIDNDFHEANKFLNTLASQFQLSEDEKKYVCSRSFIQKSQSNEASLRLARMAKDIKIKDRLKKSNKQK